MIDDKELMVNNTLLWKRDGLDGQIVHIYSINRATVRVYTDIDELREMNLSYDELHPIPLTEEILLKCGFEARSKKIWNEHGTYYLFLNGAFYIYKTNGGCYKVIHYLHTLQNLHFALTEEELICNFKLK